MIQEIKAFLARIFSRSEVAGLDPCQVQELARDVGVTTDDLYRLDRVGAHVRVLMPRRLSHEGVNPAVVQAEWPSVWKDLQRVCSVCESKDVCRHDLDTAPNAAGWQYYCSNEGTIKLLRN